MDDKTARLILLPVIVGLVQYLVVRPVIGALRRRGVLGAEPNWLSLRVRWKPIGLFLALLAAVYGVAFLLHQFGP